MTKIISQIIQYDILSGAKSILVFFIGPLDLQIAYLIVAIMIDAIFGVNVAIKTRTFKVSVLVKKLRVKLFIYCAWITMFHAFDMISGLQSAARLSVILLLVTTEILSSIKNTARLGHSRLADSLEKIYLSLAKSTPVAEVEEKKEGGDRNEKDHQN